MARLKTGVWLAAAAARGALALAAQSQQDGSSQPAGQAAGHLVQLPPVSPQPSSARVAPNAASTQAGVFKTIGGFTYDWTALEQAILDDAQVDDAYSCQMLHTLSFS